MLKGDCAHAAPKRKTSAFSDMTRKPARVPGINIDSVVRKRKNIDFSPRGDVEKLVNSGDLKSPGFGLAGSSPAVPTMTQFRKTFRSLSRCFRMDLSLRRSEDQRGCPPFHGPTLDNVRIFMPCRMS
jgi:hypothetical protein